LLPLYLSQKCNISMKTKEVTNKVQFTNQNLP